MCISAIVLFDWLWSAYWWWWSGCRAAWWQSWLLSPVSSSVSTIVTHPSMAYHVTCHTTTISDTIVTIDTSATGISLISLLFLFICLLVCTPDICFIAQFNLKKRDRHSDMCNGSKTCIICSGNNTMNTDMLTKSWSGLT